LIRTDWAESSRDGERPNTLPFERTAPSGKYAKEINTPGGKGKEVRGTAKIRPLEIPD